MNESILTPPPQPPSVADQKPQRMLQCEILALWFRTYPLRDVPAEKLTALVGPNYRSRIAELRAEPWNMRIELVPQWLERADGSKQRLLGAYRFSPFTPLGRDAGHPPAHGQLEMFR